MDAAIQGAASPGEVSNRVHHRDGPLSSRSLGFCADHCRDSRPACRRHVKQWQTKLRPSVISCIEKLAERFDESPPIPGP